MSGSGKLILTGSLGDVMKESAQLAWGWVRANSHLVQIYHCFMLTYEFTCAFCSMALIWMVSG